MKQKTEDKKFTGKKNSPGRCYVHSPGGALLNRCREWAARSAQNGPSVTAANKKCISLGEMSKTFPNYRKHFNQKLKTLKSANQREYWKIINNGTSSSAIQKNVLMLWAGAGLFVESTSPNWATLCRWGRDWCTRNIQWNIWKFSRPIKLNEDFTQDQIEAYMKRNWNVTKISDITWVHMKHTMEFGQTFQSDSQPRSLS